MKCENCDKQSVACSSEWINDAAMRVLYWCGEHAPEGAEWFLPFPPLPGFPPLPNFDEYGYPTEETLNTIREWKYSDDSKWTDLMAYVGKAWHWSDFVSVKAIKNAFGYPVWEYRCVTGGWSGNEDIIAALQSNYVFWAMCWRESHRGGKHIFEVKKENGSKAETNN